VEERRAPVEGGPRATRGQDEERVTTVFNEREGETRGTSGSILTNSFASFRLSAFFPGKDEESFEAMAKRRDSSRQESRSLNERDEVYMQMMFFVRA